MKDVKGEHPLGDAGQIILGLVFLVVWVLDSFVFKKSVFLSEYVPLAVRIAVLVISIVLAIILHLKGAVVLRDANRPVRVISSGIFKYIRHPIYLSNILFCFGLFAWSISIATFGILVIIAVFCNYLAGFEEQVMSAKFGDEYERYKKTTGRWLPR
jgi:protein-S-isoprenylcysteine O-methyltransferase Ste14